MLISIIVLVNIFLIAVIGYMALNDSSKKKKAKEFPDGKDWKI